MKHIVHVSNDYKPLTGGISTHLNCLLHELGQLNYQVTLLVPAAASQNRPDIFTDREDGKNFKVLRVTYPDDNGAVPRLIHLTQAVKTGLEYIRKQVGNIDLIHQHDQRATRPGASLFAHKQGIPIIWTNHSSGFFGADERVSRRLARLSAIKPDGLIAVHRTMAELFKEKFSDLPVCYIPNGVDTEFFYPDAPGPEKDETVIFFPQRMAPVKGPMILARAAAIILNHYPELNCTFRFAGSGIASNRDKKTISEVRNFLGSFIKNGQVNLSGNPAYEEMPGLYRQADIVVLPLQAETENISVFEAWASGTALITTKQVEKNGYVKHEENALIVPDKNPEQLAEAILTLAKDTRLRNKLVKNGRRIAEECFTWKKTALRTAEFYEMVTDRVK